MDINLHLPEPACGHSSFRRCAVFVRMTMMLGLHGFQNHGLVVVANFVSLCIQLDWTNNDAFAPEGHHPRHHRGIFDFRCDIVVDFVVVDDVNFDWPLFVEQP